MVLTPAQLEKHMTLMGRLYQLKTGITPPKVTPPAPVLSAPPAIPSSLPLITDVQHFFEQTAWNGTSKTEASEPGQAVVEDSGLFSHSVSGFFQAVSWTNISTDDSNPTETTATETPSVEQSSPVTQPVNSVTQPLEPVTQQVEKISSEPTSSGVDGLLYSVQSFFKEAAWEGPVTEPITEKDLMKTESATLSGSLSGSLGSFFQTINWEGQTIASENKPIHAGMPAETFTDEPEETGQDFFSDISWD